MAGSTSQYYPPRSRWYSPLRHPWIRFRRFVPTLWAVCDRRIIIGLRAAILSLVIPGFVFRAFGYRQIGKIAMGGCGFALLVYFVWLGYPAATISFALILSLHVTSIAFLLNRLSPNQHFLRRILSTLAVLFVLNVFVYGFLQRQLEQTLMPLRIGKNVVVVRGVAPSNIRRGDWIAYRVGDNSRSFNGGNQYGSIVLRNGFGMDQVLAGPGDVVRFGPSSFQVNEQKRPPKIYMPATGEMKISEKQWFVWPGFAIQNNNRVPEAMISSLMQSHAVISENEVVGKPFKRWFWRKQILQ